MMQVVRLVAPGPALARDVHVREPWILAACSAGLAALVVTYLPAGTDAAAHVYQRELFMTHGLTPWNNLWYAGRYSFVTYSLLYYPLAAALGIRIVAVLSVALATLGLALVLRERWGAAARWSIRAFAVLSAAFLMTGAFPFALGTAFAMLALWAARRRHASFLALTAATAATSPLAFVFLALVVVAAGLGERPPRVLLTRALVAIGAVGGCELLLNVLFASGARYPFPAASLLEATGFCAALVALSWNVPGARTLRWLGVLLGGACVTAFVVPSALGEGITRFRFAALPLIALALTLRGWRPARVSVAALAVAGFWNLSPLVSAVATGTDDPSSQEAYWRPAVTFLRTHLGPAYRVEAVDTERHWAAAYLPAAGIPLARGWFRQDDFPENAVLYGPVSAARYRQWLRGMAVRYVVLSDADLDYSAQGEAALLRSGHSGLRRVWSNRHLTIYALPAPQPLVRGTGRADVVSVSYDSVTVLAWPGRYRVAIRASPYWRASSGCLEPGTDGMLRLVVRHTEVVVLRFEVSVDGLLRALTSESHSCAP
jgi:hypothetical protein